MQLCSVLILLGLLLGPLLQSRCYNRFWQGGVILDLARRWQLLTAEPTLELTAINSALATEHDSWC